jgi:hypothetical protein
VFDIHQQLSRDVNDATENCILLPPFVRGTSPFFDTLIKGPFLALTGLRGDLGVVAGTLTELLNLSPTESNQHELGED